MCLSNEAVDELHAITSAIKTEQERRDTWLASFDAPMPSGAAGPNTEQLTVTRAEAERIFADRIAAHEARLKELGWSRTIRVESAVVPRGASGGVTIHDMPMNGELK